MAVFYPEHLEEEIPPSPKQTKKKHFKFLNYRILNCMLYISLSLITLHTLTPAPPVSPQNKILDKTLGYHAEKVTSKLGAYSDID